MKLKRVDKAMMVNDKYLHKIKMSLKLESRVQIDYQTDAIMIADILIISCP